MKAVVTQVDSMKFNAQSGAHTFTIDAKSPIGKDQGPTPKELLAIGLIGCTAMDVAALMKKYKMPMENFEVSTELEMSPPGQHPAVFKSAKIKFDVTGNVDSEKLKEAVVLSQTQYCGVTAMLAKAFPITYDVILNGEKIASGEAIF